MLYDVSDNNFSIINGTFVYENNLALNLAMPVSFAADAVLDKKSSKHFP